MLESLKQSVCDANKMLVKYNLVTLTWGNVSAIDREQGVFVIKPSGIPYDELTPESMVLIDIETGEKVSGRYRPSSDTPTHAELYRRFPSLGGVAHTHSRWATIWAQAGREIPAYGTTHADYFYGPIPCVRGLTPEEVQSAYELETGRAIADHFISRHLDPMSIPAVIQRHHGPFTWGKDALEAVHNAAVLEEIAMMAFYTELLAKEPPLLPIPNHILDKHFLRKHGPGAYYGQVRSE